MLQALKMHYNDDVLAKMFVEAMKPDNTEVVYAAKLESQLHSNWVGGGKTADDIFKLLNLNENGENLLKKPLLETRISFVHTLEKKPYELLLAKLAAGRDDVSLAKMLIAAKSHCMTWDVAGILEKVQRASWQASRKTADDIFNLLKLNEDGKNLLHNPVLSTWITYVMSLDRNPYEFLYSALKKTYDDASLAKMLDVVKRDRSIGDVAWGIEREQLNHLAQLH